MGIRYSSVGGIGYIVKLDFSIIPEHLKEKYDIKSEEDAIDFDFVWFAESELPKYYIAVAGGDFVCGEDITNYVFIDKTLSEIKNIKQEASDLKNILNSIGLITLSEFDFFHQELVS
jgi:hypothetical protein